MSPMREEGVVVAGYCMMIEIAKWPQTISKYAAERYVFKYTQIACVQTALHKLTARAAC